MILIGDKNIRYENIEKIDSISDISSTKPNSTVLFNFDMELLKYTQSNEINSAVIVNNIKEIIYSSSLNARYIIVSQELSKIAQKIADNYMLDSKILVIINSEDEMEQNAIDEIDGVIYLNRIENEK
ncbi:MAG: hypothetical protein U9N59_12435 [Campylobacterota bacterium]|nr:hypothetical protein [Campylobacterota bacterium]